MPKCDICKTLGHHKDQMVGINGVRCCQHQDCIKEAAALATTNVQKMVEKVRKEKGLDELR